MAMPIVNKANELLAEFAIFPVEPENQGSLVEYAIQNIESTLKHHTGFASGTVLRSRDRLHMKWCLLLDIKCSILMS